MVRSQDKEVVITEKGITTNVSKHDAKAYVDKSTALDSASRRAEKVKEISRKLDSLKALSVTTEQLPSEIHNRITSEVRNINSERAIRALYDSLGLDRIPMLPVREVSKEDFLLLVNDKFSSNPLLEKQDSLLKSVPTVSDLSQQRIEQAALSELAPLAGQAMNSKYFEKLDSIRAVNLKAQGLALKEHAVSEFSKVTAIGQHQNFWDKSYFEGIVGISDFQQLFVQISPALGYHFLKDLSFGIGPVIHLYEHNARRLATIGVRPFFKQEFLKQRAYVQVEYVMNPFFENAENLAINKHSLLAGAGALFRISESIAINLCVMYRVSDIGNEVSTVAPFTFRIGISSIKSKKKHD